MPARFLLIWFAASTVIYGLAFLFTKRERKPIWKQWKRIGVSAIFGVLLILPFFFINHISGV